MFAVDVRVNIIFFLCDGTCHKVALSSCIIFAHHTFQIALRIYKHWFIKIVEQLTTNGWACHFDQFKGNVVGFECIVHISNEISLLLLKRRTRQRYPSNFVDFTFGSSFVISSPKTKYIFELRRSWGSS